MNLIGGVDTVRTPGNVLVSRTRRYERNGYIYNLIKDMTDGTFLLTRFRDANNFMRGVTTMFVGREAEWGAGLTWAQAEKIAEDRIIEWEAML